MSVTAVPLRPIAKGSMLKLWLGLGALAVAGVSLAYAGTGAVRESFAGNDQFLAANGSKSGVVTTASGLQYEVLQQGTGPYPTDGDGILMNYTGSLRDGTEFDKGERSPIMVGQAVPGFNEALKLVKKGGKYRIWIKPELGYGDRDIPNPQTGEVVIPANSLLVFDVEIVEHKTRAELEAMQAEMQRMQQQQGGAPQLPPGIPGQ